MKEKKELAVLKNQSDGLLYSVDKTLKSYSDKISDELRVRIEMAVDSLKQSLLTDEYNDIKNCYDSLQEVSYKFADYIYSNKPDSENIL